MKTNHSRITNKCALHSRKHLSLENCIFLTHFSYSWPTLMFAQATIFLDPFIFLPKTCSKTTYIYLQTHCNPPPLKNYSLERHVLLTLKFCCVMIFYYFHWYILNPHKKKLPQTQKERTLSGYGNNESQAATDAGEEGNITKIDPSFPLVGEKGQFLCKKH